MNLKDAFLGLDNYFSPKVIGEVNDQYIKVVKIKGREIPWHNHKNEDELFYVVKGALLMEIENQPGLIIKKRNQLILNILNNAKGTINFINACHVLYYGT